MRLRLPANRLNSRGISVLETLIAISVMTIVVITLAASSLYASRLVTRSRLQLAAAEFQQAELERLLATPYEGLSTGSRKLAIGKAEWTVSDSSRYSRILLVTHYAPADGITISDTVAAYRLRP